MPKSSKNKKVWKMSLYEVDNYIYSITPVNQVEKDSRGKHRIHRGEQAQ